MGADQFTTYAQGADPDEAFKAAVDDAKYQYGHRGYTGTIAEKEEFVVVSAEPLPRALAESLADQLIQTDERIDDKRGPAGAIPVRADTSPDVIGWLFFGVAPS